MPSNFTQYGPANPKSVVFEIGPLSGVRQMWARMSLIVPVTPAGISPWMDTLSPDERPAVGVMVMPTGPALPDTARACSNGLTTSAMATRNRIPQTATVTRAIALRPSSAERLDVYDVRPKTYRSNAAVTARVMRARRLPVLRPDRT
jgi:hypothetical protein